MYSKLSNFLKNYEKKKPLNPFAHTSPQQAAVLVLLGKQAGEEAILLTKRSEGVEHHKGQVCFPGGVHDRLDETLWHTALRETKEELGVTPSSIGFLGELGNIFTPSGFEVHPFVGFAREEYRLNPNSGEIDEAFTVPLSHLMDEKNRHFVTRNYNGQEYQDTVFIYNSHQIWGATGRIITEFLEIWSACVGF